MSAELIVVAGPLLGERFALGSAELKMGRAPTAQVRLSDTGAAWDHCVIRPQNGGYRIVDCHTGGGTYVNGMRVREQQLEPGDQIHIGETIFAYREAGARRIWIRRSTRCCAPAPCCFCSARWPPRKTSRSGRSSKSKSSR